MKRVVLVVIAAAVAVAALVTLCRFTYPVEPIYQDKALTKWMEDLEFRKPSKDYNAASNAIVAMGTNSLPILVDTLTAQDSLFRKKAKELLDKQSLVRVQIHSAAEQADHASHAFIVLGEKAKPAISALIAKMDCDEPKRLTPIHGALKQIGGDSIPPLIDALTNQNPRIRKNAAGALMIFKTAASNAVPVLLRSLHDIDPEVRNQSAFTLVNIGADRARVIPRLIENLSDTNSNVRYFTAIVLGMCGSDAREAIPALQKASAETNANVGHAAKDALRNISPDLEKEAK